MNCGGGYREREREREGRMGERQNPLHMLCFRSFLVSKIFPLSSPSLSLSLYLSLSILVSDTYTRSGWSLSSRLYSPWKQMDLSCSFFFKFLAEEANGGT
jgi:hypothetical protein